MITKYANKTTTSAEVVNVQYYGLSTDTKPTIEVPNGSAFIEMDTGKLYFFDAAGASWVEQ